LGRRTASKCSGFSELGDGAQRQDVQASANWGTAHSVKMFRFQRTGDGAQRQDVQVSATWERRPASRFSGFSELRDGAQRQDVQASAMRGAAYPVNMFTLQRTEGRRTVSSASSVTSVKVTLKRQCGKLNTTALRRMGE